MFRQPVSLLEACAPRRKTDRRHGIDLKNPFTMSKKCKARTPAVPLRKAADLMIRHHWM
jgi:hypothetical protein